MYISYIYWCSLCWIKPKWMRAWMKLCANFNSGTQDPVIDCAWMNQGRFNSREMIKFSLPRHKRWPSRYTQAWNSKQNEEPEQNLRGQRWNCHSRAMSIVHMVMGQWQKEEKLSLKDLLKDANANLHTFKKYCDRESLSKNGTFSPDYPMASKSSLHHLK